MRYVELANKGARELGFKDNGAMWRSKYDMPPDAFAKELDRLWEQVKPLYVSLHAYVRGQASREVRRDASSAEGPDPRAPARQHVGAELGEHLPDRRAAERRSRLRPDRDPEAQEDRSRSRWCATASASSPRSASTPLPKTFWERSLFIKPRDREVVCHASAWDVDAADDLRIKMCIEITGEDFHTIHHELGHNFYQRAYNKQPFLFRDSANDGFHEAIGDTIALSITPEYLVKIGLLDKAPPRFQGHRPAAAEGAREGRVPAVRPGDRPVALEGLLRRDHAGELQQGLVGAAAEVSGRRAAGRAQRDRFRSRRQVPRRGQRARTCATSWRDILQFQFHRALCRRRPAARGR